MKGPDVLGRREVSMARVVDAPRDLVFKAWTDPKLLARWWGPRGMTTTICEIDPRPGGIFRTVARDESGNEFPTAGVFLEVVDNERLVFTGAGDYAGPTHERYVTVTEVSFEDEGQRTRITSTARRLSLAAMARSADRAD